MDKQELYKKVVDEAREECAQFTTEQEITEGNELIAKFLGCDNSKNIDGSYELYQYLECIEDGEDEQHFFLPEDMKFHESFDWLMPVVDEIGYIVYRVEEGKSWKATDSRQRHRPN
jgi:hypothetical protein